MADRITAYEITLEPDGSFSLIDYSHGEESTGVYILENEPLSRIAADLQKTARQNETGGK
jgi:hypothetical protein